MRAPAILRYPGGKYPVAVQLASYFDCTKPIMEPFAGAASVSLELLIRGCPSVILNDMDERVVRFWIDVLTRPVDLINELPVTPTIAIFESAFKKQYSSSSAWLIVNRCSMGGYGNGPIGGHNQDGKWKIGARWNRDKLSYTIRRLHRLMTGRVTIMHKDAVELLEENQQIAFVDPPYVKAGPALYQAKTDHAALAKTLKARTTPWLLTLDEEGIDTFYPEFESTRLLVSGNRRNSPERIIAYQIEHKEAFLL